MTTSGLFRTTVCAVEVTVVTGPPGVLFVRAAALIVQLPFLKAVAPVAVLNEAVLKLIVTGAAAASASGATFVLASVCEATTVSLPLLPAPVQFMIRSTPRRRWLPGSTFSVTSI